MRESFFTKTFPGAKSLMSAHLQSPVPEQLCITFPEDFTKSSLDGCQRQVSASLVRGSNRCWSKNRTVVASFHLRKTRFFLSFLFPRGKNSRFFVDTDDRDSRATPIGRREARSRIIEFVPTKARLVGKYYHVPWRKIAITLSPA